MDKAPVSFKDQEKDMICDLCPQKIIKAKILIERDKPKVEVKIKCPRNCILQHWIGKLNVQIEPLLKETTDTNTIQSKNYNGDLAEAIEDCQRKQDHTTTIADKRKRAIIILLLAKYTQDEIGLLFGLSRRQIMRIAENKP